MTARAASLAGIGGLALGLTLGVLVEGWRLGLGWRPSAPPTPSSAKPRKRRTPASVPNRPPRPCRLNSSAPTPWPPGSPSSSASTAPPATNCKEVTRVSTLYRKALDAAPEPVPACVFTRGWVRLYDRATGAELPAAPADPQELLRRPAKPQPLSSSIQASTRRELLAHRIDYAEQCRNSAAQLDRLIDLLEAR